jgi:hypothetical protein
VIAEQPCQRYAGVTRHLGEWLVKLRYRGKDLTIGHFEDPREAAYAADFTRYMLLGVKPAHWHRKVVRPNFPPSRSYLRAPVLSRLVSARVVPSEVLRRRLAAQAERQAGAGRRGRGGRDGNAAAPSGCRGRRRAPGGPIAPAR